MTRLGESKQDILFSSQYACGGCGRSFKPPSPQLFSFNSPQGMCEGMRWLGTALHVCSRVVGA